MSCQRDWITAGDVGVPIYLDIKDCAEPFALDGADVTLTFTAPNGVTFERDATITPPNRARYVSQAGDFVVPGTWSMRALIVTDDGRTLKSTCASFTVKA